MYPHNHIYIHINILILDLKQDILDFTMDQRILQTFLRPSTLADRVAHEEWKGGEKSWGDGKSMGKSIEMDRFNGKSPMNAGFSCVLMRKSTGVAVWNVDFGPGLTVSNPPFGGCRSPVMSCFHVASFSNDSRPLGRWTMMFRDVSMNLGICFIKYLQ